MEFETVLKARVVKVYEASDPNPLVMKTGEELRVGERDTTWPAFVRCRNDAGNEGWVPERFLEREGDVGLARVDYSAVELTVSVGEILSLEQEVGGWFWARTETGDRGWIPAEHVQTIRPKA